MYAAYTNNADVTSCLSWRVELKMDFDSIARTVHVHTVSYMYMYTQCHTYILPASTVDCSRQTPPHSTADVQLGRHLAGDLVQHYSKCFLCNNCADSGVDCAFNKLNGKTSRYVWLVITRYAPCCSCTSYSFWKFDWILYKQFVWYMYCRLF